MKNACWSFLVCAALMTFFSFTNNRSHIITEGDSEDEAVMNDTVPHKKKDSAKHRSKTVPYDSFGKPKKMDTTSH